MAWSTVLLQKLIVPTLSSTSHCIEPAVFTKARPLFLSLARLTQSTPFCSVALRYLLLLATAELCLWPRGLRHGFAGACLLKFCRFESCRGHGCVFCEYCLCCRVKVCDGPITLPEESWRVCCVKVLFRNLNDEEA